MPNLILPKRYTTEKPPLGSQIDWGNPLSRGLVGCWLMNEGGGNLVNDIARKNNGTNIGAIWLVGKQGDNLDFVTDDYVTLGEERYGLDLASSFSIVYLARIDVTNVTQVIVSRRESVNNYPYNSYHSSLAAGKIRLAANAGSDVVVTSSTSIVAGVPFFYSVTRLGTTVNMYFNGKPDEGNPFSLTIGSSDTDAPVYMGCQDFGSGRTHFLNGAIWFMYIYSRALSPSEIQQLYQAPYQMIAPRRRFIIDMTGGEPEPPPSTVTPYGYLSCNKGFW